MEDSARRADLTLTSKPKKCATCGIPINWSSRYENYYHLRAAKNKTGRHDHEATKKMEK